MEQQPSERRQRERAKSGDTQVEEWVEEQEGRQQRPRVDAWVQDDQTEECVGEQAPYRRRQRPRLDCDMYVPATRNERHSVSLASVREWLQTMSTMSTLMSWSEKR